MGISSNIDRVIRAAETTKRELGPRMERALLVHGTWFDAHFQDTAFARYPGPGNEDSSRDQVYRRSSALYRSVRHVVVPKGAESRLGLRVGDGATRAYARLQEYGGTIRPKRAKNLTIPLRANLTPAGRMRRSARDLFADKSANAFIFTRGNAKFIAIDPKDDGKIQLMFVLKKQVVVPPRLGFRAATRSSVVRNHRSDTIRDGVRAAIAKGFGKEALR